MNKKISICIPTFNRSKFLKKTLDNLLKINKSIYEIIIVDGSSSDNTKDVLHAYAKKFINLKFFIRDKNYGVDNDLQYAIIKSSGEYCWLFGSDDFVDSNKFKILLKIIQNNSSDIFLFNRYNFRKNKIIGSDDWLNINFSKKFEFTCLDDLSFYFDSVNSLGGLFSFLSSIIVKKNRWIHIKRNNDITGSCFEHAYIILSIIKEGASLFYINERIVLCRMDNDSFLNNNLFNRIKIDYLGYKTIFKVLFYDNTKLLNSYSKIIRNTHKIGSLLQLRASCSSSQWASLGEIFIFFKYNFLKILFCGFMGRLKFLIIFLVYLKRIIEEKKSNNFI